MQAAIFAVIALAGLSISPEMRDTIVSTITEVIQVVQGDTVNE